LSAFVAAAHVSAAIDALCAQFDLQPNRSDSA
jgi:hypothetical protein